MKQLLITIAAVVLVGCGEFQQSSPSTEVKPAEPVAEATKPEPKTAIAPDISIHNAAKNGNIEAVKQHLTAGTDANVKGGLGNFSTPLTVATMNGHSEIAKLLIAKGVDINAPDDGGWTPLHFAAWDGNKEITELLIAKGADVNAKNKDEETVLHVVGNGNKEIVELLIAKGVDVNAKDNLGRTSLHFASGYEEIVELLIAEGADVNAKIEVGIYRGNTPLDEAIKFEATETVDLLRKHGGKTGEELKAEGK